MKNLVYTTRRANYKDGYTSRMTPTPCVLPGSFSDGVALCWPGALQVAGSYPTTREMNLQTLRMDGPWRAKADKSVAVPGLPMQLEHRSTTERARGLSRV